MEALFLKRFLGRGAGAERLVLGALPQAIVAVDSSERIVFVNSAAAALLGDAVFALAGRSLHQVIETVADDGGRGCALCLTAAQTPDQAHDAVLVVGTGRVPVRWTAAPMMDREERIGTVVTLEQPTAPDEIERRARERGAREMQAMLADLAHELNNPLTVILAGAGLLRENTGDDFVRRRVELMSEAAERCVGIVRTFRSSVLVDLPADASAVTTSTAPRRARAQILVVDDDALVASAMAAALAAEGHEVDVAEDGVAALARISARRYDVVLTDVRMPRLDGPGLYKELGRIRPELTSRVIFVTGDTLSPATRRFLETVGAPSVRKPFEPRQLRAAVRSLLNGEPRRDIA